MWPDAACQIRDKLHDEGNDNLFMVYVSSSNSILQSLACVIDNGT